MKKIKLPETGFNATLFLKHTPELPGVYCMLDKNKNILYVGKANHLKKRLTSYFQKSAVNSKVQVMVNKIASVDLTVTANETEALLLEQTLIKKHLPLYNILLRDDKSYPYIYLSPHAYPGLYLYRGRKKKHGVIFGPYPNAGAARESLKVLQKLFKVRQCKDSYFSNRTRPCLQYQIDRCKAPCVGYVDNEEYQEDVAHSVKFLKGRGQEVIKILTKKMDASATSMNYEEAIVYRNQIQDMQRMQATQAVDITAGNVDVIGICVMSGKLCVEVLFFRQGALQGHRYFISNLKLQESTEMIISTFLEQFYVLHVGKCDYPKEILIPCVLQETKTINEVINRQAGLKVVIKTDVRGDRKRWQAMAEQNAKQKLEQHLSNKNSVLQRLISLQQGLELEAMPERIECFDISHTQGEGTVASCVVFNQEGAVSSEYRRFNIKEITPGDDYAAMKQAVKRRYQKFSPNEEYVSENKKLPDLLLIDGGKGQINTVLQALITLELTIPVYGVAKGEGRKAGLETIINAVNGKSYQFEKNHPGFLLVQQVRDEAHRFAIAGHRARRLKARTTSVLESIEGIGAKKRSALMRYFGGLQGIKQAGIDDLVKVRGISHQLAEEIYRSFRS